MRNSGFEIALGGDSEEGYGNRKIEAARTAGARVEVEDAFTGVEIRRVGVAGENRGEAAGGWVEAQGFEVVEHVDVAAFGEGDLGLRQLGALPFPVDIAANGGDGRDLAQFFKDGEIAHVATVEDPVDAGEGGRNFGTEEAVCVADDADFHTQIDMAAGRILRLFCKRSADPAAVVALC